jgi:predicted nucleic acid-binding OB-fold protein
MQEKDDKRKVAQLLFIEGFTQDHICKILNISPNTTTRWKEQDSWVDKKIRKTLAEDTTRDLARKILNYELELLNYHVDTQMELPIEERVSIEAGAADKVVKLFRPLVNDEVKNEQRIRITRNILKFVMAEDLELAKLLEPVLNRFINEMSKSFN